MIEYKIPSVADIKRDLKENGYKFTVVSFFAGGGGSSTGYRMAGGHVLAINEFIEEARNTYKANWPDTKIFPQDIRELTAEQIMNDIKIKKGELDILDGSPPCCAFSDLGKKEKLWGNSKKKYSDSSQSNIEDLFLEYFRMVEGFMPKCFIAENVVGITKGIARGYINIIFRKAREIGYHLECKILDAQYLGVPQMRHRVIFIGIRNDIWKETYKNKLHPQPFPYKIPLKVAFKGIINSSEELAYADISKYKIYEILKKLKPGTTNSGNYCFELVKNSPLKPSFCIIATSAKVRSASGVCHWDNRKHTIKEYKRIFSVPDDYILTGTLPQQGERLSRMVPPLMMKAIVENLYNLVLKEG